MKKEGVASVDLLREIYATLLDVDIDAQLWSVIVRGVTFLLSTNILAAFLGM